MRAWIELAPDQVVALHNLIDNRIVNKEKERASDEAAANKDKEGEAKKDSKEGEGKKDEGKENKANAKK